MLENAPFLVSNSGPDLLTISSEDFSASKSNFENLVPNNEPTIGVLDTGFPNDTYFKEMVDYNNALGEEYDPNKYSDFHGTEIDSILVDGSTINGDRFDDGCGLFQVRHFAVTKKDGDSSAAILKRIKKIVTDNPDIHVWNLSLGSDFPVDDNYISYEGNFLDNKKILIFFTDAGNFNDILIFEINVITNINHKNIRCS